MLVQKLVSGFDPLRSVLFVLQVNNLNCFQVDETHPFAGLPNRLETQGERIG